MRPDPAETTPALAAAERNTSGAAAQHLGQRRQAFLATGRLRTRTPRPLQLSGLISAR
jgi:hypothetical protein